MSYSLFEELKQLQMRLAAEAASAQPRSEQAPTDNSRVQQESSSLDGGEASAKAAQNALAGEETNQTKQTPSSLAGSGIAALPWIKETKSKPQGNPPICPSADVAEARRPEASGTGGPTRTSRPEASGTSGTRLPANWQEIDPHAYQPRPFGPMETDADWPGEDEEDKAAPPLPAIDAGGEAPSAGTGAPQPTPRRPASGATGAPLAGEPFADLEERCWLCEEEAELYDPSGQGWCFLCLEVAGKTEGWQDLVDLLPAVWRRKEEHQQLAVFAAAHYHQAGRREIAVRWSQPPFHQRLKGADLFRAFARWLAAPERWKQREAERLLERLVEHQGQGVWRR
jgi:hypothetical protein